MFELEWDTVYCLQLLDHRGLLEEGDAIAKNCFISGFYRPGVSFVHDLLYSFIACRLHLGRAVCFFCLNDQDAAILSVLGADIKSAEPTFLI